MSDVFLERRFGASLGISEIQNILQSANGCLHMHRVDWQMSLLAADGRQMICRFNGPDAESVRIALRDANTDIGALWAGTVHDAPGLNRADLDAANVVVTRAFDKPVTLEKIQSIEDAGAWCLETHSVKFVRTFFSINCKRMVCIYRAPDAESVRLAQRQAGMPVDRVWGFRPIRPGHQLPESA
jgi:hypothetical protein